MSRNFQPESCPKEGIFFLEASAGTGKTHALEEIVARLVGRDENPLRIENILVVTFTNRAAREMKERIRSHLLSLSRAREGEERDRYLRAISSFDRAAIYTIHSFCRMVLAAWPFESASPFRQELLVDGAIERRETRTWIANLRKESFNWKLIGCAYRHRRDVEEMIQGLAHEISSDNIPAGAEVKPGEKDLLNFVNFFESSEVRGSSLEKAGNELFGRDWDAAEIKAVFKEGGGRKQAKSIERIQEHMAACRGIKDVETLLGMVCGRESEKHFLELLKTALTYEAANFKLGKSLADAIAGFFAQMEPYVELPPEGQPDSLVDRYMQLAFIDSAAREIQKRVERVKLSSGQWGYADLIHRVAKAVEASDSPLLSMLRNRFSAALIDEFQDTDSRQWEIFRRIFGEKGRGHLLGLIGDPKQSIYSFRGANLLSYLEAKNMVPRNKVFRLGVNYRSKKELVRAVNRLFAPLFESAEFGFDPVEPGYRGERALEWADDGAAINILGIKKDEYPAAVIASYIRKLLDSKLGGFWRRADGKKERVLASDIAVLTRKKREEEEIFLLLGKFGIRARRLRDSSVFNQEIVKPIDVMLSAFDRPRDISRWRSLLLGCFFSLPPLYLDLFEREGKLDGFIEKGDECRVLFNSGNSTKAMEDFFQFAAVLGGWICDAGDEKLGAYLTRPWPERILSEAGGEREWQDWRHICELIQEKQSEGMRDISLIREWMEEESAFSNEKKAIRLESEEPAVRVLTMHKAKGLEFPLVFIHGGYDKNNRNREWEKDYRFIEGDKLVVDRLRLNSNWKRHLQFKWEEDRRLWYVAFTRAKERMWSPIMLEGGLTQGESLLAQALGADGVDSEEAGRIPPHQILAKKDGEVFRESLNERLRNLCREAPKLFSFSIGTALNFPPLRPPATPEPVSISLPAAPLGNRDLVRSSFTSLTSANEFISDVSRGANDVILSLDFGANFGTLVHKFFEHCDFEMARELEEEQWCSDGEINRFFSNITMGFYDRDWYEQRALSLKRIVWRCLRANVPELGRLCDVQTRARRAEVEFLMAVRSGARIDLKDGEVKISRGFLKGYIDLLVCAEGRWWVVDWKTNLPPEKHWEGVYDSTILGLIMDEHHYHLQYELYLLALCGSLSAGWGRAVSWEEEIGGAACIFVRGTGEGHSGGIFFEKPSRERMLSFASEMGVGNVLE